MIKAIVFVLLMSLASMHISCGTNKTQSKTQQMLNSRVALMNYEEALQRFGPPTQCAEAGNTKTCTWIYGSGGTSILCPLGEMFLHFQLRLRLPGYVYERFANLLAVNRELGVNLV